MSDEIFTIRVDCFAQYGGEPAPRSFRLQDRVVVVAEILDRWLALDHRYFKVRGDDGHLYILRYDEGADRWELTLFQRGG